MKHDESYITGKELSMVMYLTGYLNELDNDGLPRDYSELEMFKNLLEFIKQFGEI